MRRARLSGFSLLELLLVIAVISLLVTLTLPAVQSAREAGRRATCVNQLHQIGLAFQAHHAAQGFLPSGGWGWGWLGDPDRGFGREQPGGWVYNLLPYIEQDQVRLMGAGTPVTSSERTAAAAARLHVLLPGFVCPSRREVQLYPVPPTYTPFYCDPITEVARGDYAANGGDAMCEPTFNLCQGPSSLADGNSPEWGADLARIASIATGVMHAGSQVRYSQITDGTSKTYMVGEKLLDPRRYYKGTDPGDNESLLMGANEDICRWTLEPPKPDLPRLSTRYLFGSAHPATCNMVFCDGSVHSISYLIDPTLHHNLGNRKDGSAVDVTGL